MQCTAMAWKVRRSIGEDQIQIKPQEGSGGVVAGIGVGRKESQMKLGVRSDVACSSHEFLHSFAAEHEFCRQDRNEYLSVRVTDFWNYGANPGAHNLSRMDGDSMGWYPCTGNISPITGNSNDCYIYTCAKTAKPSFLDCQRANYIQGDNMIEPVVLKSRSDMNQSWMKRFRAEVVNKEAIGGVKNMLVEEPEDSAENKFSDSSKAKPYCLENENDSVFLETFGEVDCMLVNGVEDLSLEDKRLMDDKFSQEEIDEMWQYGTFESELAKLKFSSDIGTLFYQFSGFGAIATLALVCIVL